MNSGSIKNTVNLHGSITSLGARGYSNYEIAVQNGFEGTEQEWLDSLVGPVGPRGPIGPNNFHVGEEEPEDENVSVWLDSDEPIPNTFVPVATEETLGTIKPGNNLKVDKYGKLEMTIYANNIEEMVNSKLKPQDVVRTLGYYEPNDGGGALYLIREKTENDVEDKGSIHFVGDTLVAELIVNDVINIKQFGAKGDDSTNNTSKIQSCINFTKNKDIEVYIPEGIYQISQLTLYRGIVLTGLNNEKSILKSIPNNNNNKGLLVFENNGIVRTSISNIKFDGNKENNNHIFDGIYFFTTIEQTDAFCNLEKLEIDKFTGNGLTFDGTSSTCAIREARVINVRCALNDKNGFNIVSATDCMFAFNTASFNRENGFYFKGANHKVSNCKAHTNGYGDWSTIDYDRTPASAYVETSDTSYVSGKTYFTRSGSGTDYDTYKFSKFEGSTFENSVTYYELTKNYYKRYSGFLIEGSRNIFDNLEAQDNYGDGAYINGYGNSLSNFLADCNGRLSSKENIYKAVSYESLGLEPIYDGIHCYYYGPINISTVSTNFRYSEIGLCQRYALCVEKANSRINAMITATLEHLVGAFKMLDCDSDNFVVVNGKEIYQEYDSSRLSIIEGYSIFNNKPYNYSFIRKNGNKVHLRLLIIADEFMVDNNGEDIILTTLPSKFIPNTMVSCVGILTNNQGYTHKGYCTANIYRNGQVVFRPNTSIENVKGVLIETTYEN